MPIPRLEYLMLARKKIRFLPLVITFFWVNFIVNRQHCEHGEHRYERSEDVTANVVKQGGKFFDY